jgi:hypothetical protein
MPAVPRWGVREVPICCTAPRHERMWLVAG